MKTAAEEDLEMLQRFEDWCWCAGLVSGLQHLGAARRDIVDLRLKRMIADGDFTRPKGESRRTIGARMIWAYDNLR